MSTRSALLPALLSFGCAITHAPQVPLDLRPPSPDPAWQAALSAPGPITLRSEVSARWAVPAGGLVDLDDPAAAALVHDRVPILLPVHVLTHPEAGVITVDTGISDDLAAGDRGPLRGLVRAVVGSVEPVAGLATLLGGDPPDQVLLTHAHLDHILGLPDVPADTPVVTGPGELAAQAPEHALLRRTHAQLFDGRTGLRSLDPADAVPLGPIDHAWDLLGDGSLYALWTPGHTPGSLAYLARTPTGPVLFTGDACHTRWGWEHDVVPGTFTADAAGNRASLDALQSLADALPSLVVFVGHELDGAGTGMAVAAEGAP